MGHTIRSGLTALAIAVGLAGALIVGTANAALVDCPASFTTDPTAKVTSGGTTAVAACRYISPADSSNVASEDNVNAAGFFGITSWEATSVLQVDQNALSGTWSIPDVDFSAFDYIIVFKDGADTNLVAFLFDGSASSGDWTTPFTDPPFNLTGGPHAVSHLSIFRTVPEPGTLALLGSALIGLAMLQRRRRVV